MFVLHKLAVANMGMTFLQQTAQYIKNNFSAYSDLEIVFPTRRACNVFKKDFSTQFSGPLWLPQIISIEEFVASNSAYKIAQEWQLITSLYEIYSRVNEQISFEEFYPWGKIILNDFDETDNYLVDAEKLFRILRDLADIDKQFEWDEEQLEFIRQFWESLLGNNFDENKEGIRKHFINNWKYLYELYTGFKNTIIKEGYVYKGLAMQQIIAKCEAGFFDGRQIIFAGFYALTYSEEVLFTRLQDKGIATLFWDLDDYYYEDESQEAGYYLRRKKYIKPEAPFKASHFTTSQKNINATGATMVYGQVQHAAGILKMMMHDNKISPQNIAVVLPDEKLLLPLLQSIPDNIVEINITMGYPLKNSFVDSLTDTYLQLLTNCQKSKTKVAVSKFYLSQFAAQPLSAFVLNLERLQQRMQRYNYGYFNLQSLADDILPEFLQLMHADVDDFHALFENVIDLLQLILHRSGDTLMTFETTMLRFAIISLQNAADDLTNDMAMLTQNDAAFIIKQIIQTLRVPFESETRQGLQVMGFLETRNLDFENVIILSMNEGTMPSTVSAKTYIPFSLRKAFKLPTHEHNDALYAYHFYRLLQRADNIHLIYNTEVNKMGGGEKSRFLLQLELEMCVRFPNIRYLKHTATILPDVFRKPEIDVVKSPGIMQKLQHKFLVEHKAFSATAFTTYLACPLRFYYNYVEGIKEPPSEDEEMQASEFGTILHRTLRELYHPKTKYTKNALINLKRNINSSLDKAISEEYHENNLQGMDIISREIIARIIGKIIDHDIKRAPVFIDGIEQDIHFAIKCDENLSVWVKGNIDRIETDLKVNTIVDFKTGKVELSDKIENYFDNPKLKTAFQLMLYAMAYRKIDCKVAAYPLQQAGKGFLYLFNAHSITTAQYNLFESELKRLITNIFDESIPFSATENLDTCKSCPYNGLCWRN